MHGLIRASLSLQRKKKKTIRPSENKKLQTYLYYYILNSFCALFWPDTFTYLTKNIFYPFLIFQLAEEQQLREQQLLQQQNESEQNTDQTDSHQEPLITISELVMNFPCFDNYFMKGIERVSVEIHKPQSNSLVTVSKKLRKNLFPHNRTEIIFKS